MAKLVEGDLAPEFSLLDQEGNTIALRDLLGKNVIIFFYPKDDTPGCTKEACQFNDLLPDFATDDAVILGISADSAESHGKFRAKYGLNFQLLIDQDHKVMESYGAYGEKVLYGKTTIGVIRSTFLIGPDQKVKRAWYHVKADGHAEKVLAALKS
ncbi:MAG TPA: thioredoxin-dependent thiol peroxidase [Acidimicrobiales bacterium]|nr:thioredoxin-dependent thiol peroxidase [Acidimicrobiales bacterium]